MKIQENKSKFYTTEFASNSFRWFLYNKVFFLTQLCVYLCSLKKQENRKFLFFISNWNNNISNFQNDLKQGNKKQNAYASMLFYRI